MSVMDSRACVTFWLKLCYPGVFFWMADACAGPWFGTSAWVTWPSTMPRRSRSRQRGAAQSSGSKATAVPSGDPGGTRRVMEPSLLDLLTDCPRDVPLWLENLGVQTCADVHHMWKSGGAMTEEYEAGERLPADHAFTLAMVWTLCSKKASMDRDQTIQTLVSERESVYPDRPVLRLESTPTDPARTPIRSMVATGMIVAVPPRVISASAAPHVKEQATKEVKVQTLFQLVLESFLDLQSLGTTVQALQDPLRLQAFKNSVMVSTQRLGVERIGALTSALRRWKRYALDKGYSVQSPSPLQLSEFLRSISTGGPTAATSMYQAMKWFQVNMGIAFQVEHFLLTPFKFHAAGHTGTQAKELDPWEMMNLIFMAQKATGTRLLVLCFFLQSAISCIRFEHAQRSSLQETAPTAMRFKCSQGKSRRQGARPAYDWVTTEIEWQGFSLLATLRDYLANEALPDSQFLWPALLLEASDLWQVHDSTALLIDKKMSRARYLELFRGCLLEMGLDRQEAISAGYNRLRRFMPTLAGCLQASPEELQAVGSWIELPAGGGPQPRDRREKATMPMGLHYSGQKAHRSAMVKLKLWKRFMFLARNRLSSLALTSEGLLAPKSWTWPELCEDHQRLPVGEETLPVEDIFTKDQAVAGKEPASPEFLSWSSPRVVDGKEEQPTSSQPPGEARPPAPDALPVAARESESDISSSASDKTASGSELEGILPPGDVSGTIRWFVQGKKAHIVQHGEAAGQLIPWCRDSPFVQEASRSGDGLDPIASMQICQRCLGRMPRAMYAAISEHMNWLHWWHAGAPQ